MFVGQLVSKMPVAKLRASASELVDSSTLIGVEVEVEGCKTKLPTGDGNQYWRQEADDSLRNNGAEFVFAEPLWGADVIKAVQFLCVSAKMRQWVISERTGLHVHMDVREMELDKFRNFCVMYALMEKPLYRWIGDNRDKNIHCLAWFTAEGDLKEIGKIFKVPGHASGVIKQLNRYSGLNLNALDKYGSVEFRHMKSTFDSTRVIDWINMILSLRLAAIAWNGKTDEIIKEFKILGPFTFMHRVFGPRLTAKLWYPDFVYEAKGYAATMAAHVLEASKAVSKKEEAKQTPSVVFTKTLSALKEQNGDHPGVIKYKKKLKEQQDQPKIKGKYGPAEAVTMAKKFCSYYGIMDPAAVEIIATGGTWHFAIGGAMHHLTLNGIDI